MGSETASNVINVLNAKAEFEDKTRKINLRVASITSNETFTIYYDLTDKATSIKVPLSGHCIPEEQGDLVKMLNNFFGSSSITTSSTNTVAK